LADLVTAREGFVMTGAADTLILFYIFAVVFGTVALVLAYAGR